MSTFIQSLEERRLFSATSASLAVDLSTINSDAKAVKANLSSLMKTAAADLKALTADLKGSVKTNAPLLKTLKTDEAKYMAKLKVDVNSLLKGTVLAKKSVAAGNAVLKKSTATNTAKLSADITALGGVTTTPMANLTADSASTTLSTDAAALTSANPLNTQLASDATKLGNDIQTGSSTLVASGTTFSSAIIALQSDLTTIA